MAGEDMDIDDIINNIQDDRKALKESVDRSAAEDAERLKRAWISERTCPELLKFEGNLLDRIMIRIREQVRFFHKRCVVFVSVLIHLYIDGIYRRKYTGSSSRKRY